MLQLFLVYQTYSLLDILHWLITSCTNSLRYFSPISSRLIRYLQFVWWQPVHPISSWLLLENWKLKAWVPGAGLGFRHRALPHRGNMIHPPNQQMYSHSRKQVHSLRSFTTTTISTKRFFNGKEIFQIAPVTSEITTSKKFLHFPVRV